MPRKRSSWVLLWLSAAVAATCAYSYYTVDWALRVHHKHVPDPEEIVVVEGRQMSAWDAARTQLFPRFYPEERLSVPKHWLLYRHQTRLWLLLFTTNALVGWCASIWLMMVAGNIDNHLIPRVLLALLVGPVSFLLVKALPSWDLFGVGQALPLLGGLFVTTFFEGLRGLLAAFFTAVQRRIGGSAPPVAARKPGSGGGKGSAVALLAALCLPVFSSAQETQSYFVCTDPKKPPCWAFSHEGKKSCPSCVTWTEVFPEARVRGLLSLLANNYRGRANVFLDDAAQAIYGEGLPETDSGSLVKTTQLYESPQEYGFREIPADDADAGTLVVFPRLGGVVVDVATEEGPEQALLYPSARASGSVVLTRSLESLGEAKFLVPQEVSEVDQPRGDRP